MLPRNAYQLSFVNPTHTQVYFLYFHSSGITDDWDTEGKILDRKLKSKGKSHPVFPASPAISASDERY